MMAKIVARMVKMKAGNLGGIQRHNQRETDNHSNEDIDTERSYLNYDLVNESPVKYNEHIREIIDSQKVSNRAVRKDAVLVDEWIITSEKSFFEGINQREFFQSAVDYFSDRCGSQNIAYATVHLDETTPHMHLGIVPMTEGRLSSKAVFNRQSLKEIQEELPIYLLNQGFDIERGLRGSERQHLSVPEYKEVQEKVAELNERLPAFRERAEKLVQKENHLAEKVRTLDEMANDALETLEVARGEGDYAYEWTDKNINSIFTEKKSLLGKPFHVVRHEDFLELKNKAASLYTDKGLNNKLRKKVQSLQIEN
ncbi:Plasmid recombination enzyme, partial [Enterococcus malodoratus]|uniref:MobV family relaxase n=1 Tax=Enterococcus malodoratus TaxID=71451 RepID=UPI0008D70E04